MPGCRWLAIASMGFVVAGCSPERAEQDALREEPTGLTAWLADIPAEVRRHVGRSGALCQHRNPSGACAPDRGVDQPSPSTPSRCGAGSSVVTPSTPRASVSM